jgi:four helix bundle protein
MAQQLEDFPVYREAKEFQVAVNAIIVRPVWGRNRRLRDQIAEATESILANMEEGYEQSTDAGLAKYLYTSKGSTAEVVGRLRSGARRRWLTQQEFTDCAKNGRGNSAYARRLESSTWPGVTGRTGAVTLADSPIRDGDSGLAILMRDSG